MSSGSAMYLNDGQELSFKSKKNHRVIILFSIVALGLGFLIGILIGKFAACDENDQPDGVYLSGVPETLISEADPDVSQKIIDGIEPARIEENLRVLSLEPHIAGRDRDFALTDLIKDRFQESGLHVQTTPYDVLLSYPGKTTPNSVRLLDAANQVVYDAARDESDFSQMPGVVPPFNAYSPPGLVEGQLVYAGYGRVEDYLYLHNQNISVSGHLVIVKYGKIFRGDKVDLAADHGATGIIIYSDPADTTGYNIGDPRVYPDTLFLPPTGAQRGTIFTGDGDPLTPGYPSNSLAYRHSEDDVFPALPKIPCHPIGYGAAFNILKLLGGPAVPADSDFRGGLNITYKVGPGFVDPKMRIQLNVTTRNEQARADNVFGIIKGTVEPDRYVLFGNHRDAWIYGAMDPSSGTAVMLEMARVMGELVKKGEWKPRRSIVFCSWGAEEYGLVGSTEWVEQYVTTLRERSVAYVNVDIAVEGNDTLDSSATPLMYNIVYEAAKKVKNPNPSEVQAGRSTVYDTWVKTFPWEGHSMNVPAIYSLGSGSDYAPFIQISGITAIDVRYTIDSNVYKVSSYPLYHTEYEVFDVVKNQYDRDFEFHTAVARVSGEMVRNLADSLILPFNITNYAAGLEMNRLALDKDYGTTLKQKLGQAVYDKLATIIVGFAEDVKAFEARIPKVNKNNPFAIRAINDQIMFLERAFLNPDGLPARPRKKHLIVAENMNDAYAGSSFPGLVDLLFEIDKEPARWERVKQHFHAILQTIQSAGATLREVTDFMSETM